MKEERNPGDCPDENQDEKRKSEGCEEARTEKEPQRQTLQLWLWQGRRQRTRWTNPAVIGAAAPGPIRPWASFPTLCDCAEH